MTIGEAERPGVIAPPPLLFFGFLLLGFASESIWPTAVIPGRALDPVGWVFIVLGVVIFGFALRQFPKAGTSVETRKPTTALITGGPYRLSRNPIYLGASLAFAGTGLVTNSGWLLGLLLPFLLLIRYGVIAREEAYLERKFGQAYRCYKASTRRWL
jgi:protein-S-isoprenylcysteine O-methyltransferase Ste14